MMMKRMLKADMFELFKTSSVYVVCIVAVVLGFGLPAMYFGIVRMFDLLAQIEEVGSDPSFQSAVEMLGILNGKTVFLSSIPFSQGFGIVVTAMIGAKSVRQFSNGVVRNEIIAGIPRRDVYLSRSVVSLLISMPSMIVYTLVTAFASFLMFGDLGLDGRNVAEIAVISAGIYLAYTAIPVFIAFITRSMPVTLVITILFPMITQGIVSIIGAALINAPEWVFNVFSVLPSFQCFSLQSASVTDTMLIVSAVSDVILAAAFTVFGIIKFRRADLK